jgi:ribonuclease Z
MENFSVTILGSSSATPTSYRHTSGQLVNFYQRLYLVDCGEGTQIQLRKNHIKLSKIHHIFISHLHGDHFFGLVGFISSINLFGRKKPLHIYADMRIREIIELQLKVSETVLQFDIIYHPLDYQEKTLIFEDKRLEVYSFPLEHRVPACGFLFQEKPLPRNMVKRFIKMYDISVEEIREIRQGKDFITNNGELISNQELTLDPPPPRSFAYCSDTRYFETLPALLTDVELLYSECTFMKDLQEVATDKYHMTTTDACLLAENTRAKKLIVGHFSARYKDLTDFKLELKAMNPNAELVHENHTYHVRDEKE